MFTQNDFTQSTLPKQSNAKQYVLYTFIFLIILALGVLIGLEIPVIRHRTYTDGWNAAKTRLAESEQFGFLGKEGDTLSLVGVVVDVRGNQIAIKTNPLSPLSDPELDTRVVLLSDVTKITRIVPRQGDAYQKEIESYMQKIRTGKGDIDLTPPVSFTVETATNSDIKNGDSIMVTADQNINNLKSFSVLEVQIQ
ncbi:MAG: hypothetical protein KBB75_01425 [Candidatus Pacebacteria bacterium]|nr:hypothetical protein [Candidatus Paceibacterota bacterium]